MNIYIYICRYKHVSIFPGLNILELYSVLLQVRFATSETKLDIYYNKLDIRVAEKLKT